MESHPCRNEKEEEVTNEIRFLLAMAQRNSRKAKILREQGGEEQTLREVWKESEIRKIKRTERNFKTGGDED